MKKLTMVLMSGLVLAGIPKAVFGVENEGTVQVTVIDENGAVMNSSVPVYIYGTGKNKFVGGKEIPGQAMMSLQAGTYKMSAVTIRHNGEYVDRFASNEAFVQVVAGDNVSVVLTLKPIDSKFMALAYSEVAPAETNWQGKSY